MKRVLFFILIFVKPILYAEPRVSLERSIMEHMQEPTRPHMKMISQGAIQSLYHYYKFYGDNNTVYGNFFERSYILSSMTGLRDRFVEHGIYIDASVEQFFGSNLTGGANNDVMRYNGNAEYWFTLDAGRANLWPAGAIVLHAETSWQISVNNDVGSLVGANDAGTLPVPGKAVTTLSEVVLEQVFGKHFLFRIGKLDAIGPLDDNNFANTSRYQFMNSGLVNNPIIFTFIPHTLLAVLPIWSPSKKHTIKFLIADADGQADKSGFKTLFNSNITYVMQYQYEPKIKGTLPGTYRVIPCFSSKKITNYAVNQRILAGQDITSIPIATRSDNYALLLNFDQYVWIDDAVDYTTAYLHEQPPVGFGLFGRAGWAPQDRNVIDQFYSFGVGGFGMPCTERYYDFWGIGYTITHVSHNLRHDLKEQNIVFNACEHAVEAFYNFQLSPALHLSFDAQVIKPPLCSRHTAFVLQSRLRMDF